MNKLSQLAQLAPDVFEMIDSRTGVLKFQGSNDVHFVRIEEFDRDRTAKALLTCELLTRATKEMQVENVRSWYRNTNILWRLFPRYRGSTTIIQKLSWELFPQLRAYPEISHFVLVSSELGFHVRPRFVGDSLFECAIQFFLDWRRVLAARRKKQDKLPESEV